MPKDTEMLMSGMRMLIYNAPAEPGERLLCCDFTDQPRFREDEQILFELSLEGPEFTKIRLLLALVEPTGTADDLEFALEELILKAYEAGKQARS